MHGHDPSPLHIKSTGQINKSACGSADAYETVSSCLLQVDNQAHFESKSDRLQVVMETQHTVILSRM